MNVVLLHGMGSGPEQLRPTAQALERLGHRTLLVDLRGPSATAMVSEVEAAVAGTDRAVLVGVSMGAAVALAFALAHRDEGDVAALVLVGPAVGPEGLHEQAAQYVRAQAAVLEASGFAGLRDLARRSAPAHDLVWQLEVIDGLERRFGDPPALLSLWRGFPGATVFDRWEALDDLDLPTTVVCWPEDGLHPVELARTTAAHLGAELVIIDRPGPEGLDAPALAALIDVACR